MHSDLRKLTVWILTLLAMCFAFAAVAQAAQTPESKACPSSAKITATQAEKIALKKFPGKIVEKTKIENEEGVWQYAVMVKSGKTLREVMINVQTGKIVKVEVTTAAGEKDEAAKEKAKEKGKSPEKAGSGSAGNK